MEAKLLQKTRLNIMGCKIEWGHTKTNSPQNIVVSEQTISV